ncbi:MAG: FG-GAP repeat domain-containing protein [Steroidobacteraceae bacterium]
MTHHLNSNGSDDQDQQDQGLLGQDASSASVGLAVATAAAAAGGGGMASGATSGSTTYDLVTAAGSGLTFNNTFTGSANQYTTAITAAENTLQALATNTLNENVTWVIGNFGATGDLATNNFGIVKVSFSQLTSAIASHESTAVGAAAVASFSGLSDPSGGGGFWIPVGYAHMLGLDSDTGTDTVSLNTYYLSGNGQDVINAFTHELSEGTMGRIGGLGYNKVNGTSPLWSTMDLFSFNASGQRDFSVSDNARGFSYNDGASVSNSLGLTFFAANSGNDAADFQQLDVFGTGTSGETFGLSQTDLQMMEALGWNPTNQGTPGVLPTYVNDFNGAGPADILWTNGAQLGIWTENANLNPTWTLLSPNTNGWSVVGSGDYNGDGINDILWENANQLGVWTESSNLSPTWTLLSPNLNGWSVVGGGDYNGATSGAGDKISDILFQNGQQLGVWLESSNLSPTWKLLSPNLNGWSVVGSGDYNGDGISDILFQNGSQLGVWTESSNLTPTWSLLSSNENGWSVVGSGDYTGSGISDILWSNGSQLGVWIESSNLTPTWHLLSSNENGWSVVGSSDYNGAVSSSGHQIDDILWSNGCQLGVWTEDGNLNPTWHLLSSNTNGWVVTGAGSPGIR